MGCIQSKEAAPEKYRTTTSGATANAAERDIKAGSSEQTCTKDAADAAVDGVHQQPGLQPLATHSGNSRHPAAPLAAANVGNGCQHGAAASSQTYSPPMGDGTAVDQPAPTCSHVPPPAGVTTTAPMLTAQAAATAAAAPAAAATAAQRAGPIDEAGQTGQAQTQLQQQEQQSHTMNAMSSTPAASSAAAAAPQPPRTATVVNGNRRVSDSGLTPVLSGIPAATATAALPPMAPSAASSSQGLSAVPRTSQPGLRSVKFADSSSQDGGESSGGKPPRRSLPRRSQSHYNTAFGQSSKTEMSEAVIAKQADILRANKTGKLRQRRGGLDTSFAAMQGGLAVNEKPLAHVNTRAAGLKHIGFGPLKKENQDEFFIQVGDFGGLPGSNLFCVFDGHGSFGKDAALYSRQLLPRLLDVELRKYFQRVQQETEEGLKGAVEVLLIEVFGDTERSLAKSGVNLANSGTTASVAYQRGNRLWVAAAGDSRAMLCSRTPQDHWRPVPLTIDHRPRRPSERERIEAAGARVAPKRLPSGRTVGEPRLWLQTAGGPGLLLSRSLGDLTAASVGCTSDPEVSYTTLRPNVDHMLVMASDGVWDVLTNEQVCDIVVESPDPHIACRRVLDAALYEWEERMSADNISVLVVEFEWGEDASTASVASLERTISGRMEDELDTEAALNAADFSR